MRPVDKTVAAAQRNLAELEAELATAREDLESLLSQRREAGRAFDRLRKLNALVARFEFEAAEAQYDYERARAITGDADHINARFEKHRGKQCVEALAAEEAYVSLCAAEETLQTGPQRIDDLLSVAGYAREQRRAVKIPYDPSVEDLQAAYAKVATVENAVREATEALRKAYDAQKEATDETS